jgi:SpoVK/Ycf46/Vps4 family AAA+-type ATPase
MQYVGEAEKLVRAVFSLARRLSPCVVFLDEIDALFGARMSARESGGAAAAHRGVITEFMQEMDGLKSSKEDGVIVIGATNRPFDLDDAVLRRLPRRLLVDLPGEKERAEILKILLKEETLGDDVVAEALAKKTESFSGSDLKHLCVSAALDAVKEHFKVPWKEDPSTKSSGVTPAPSSSSPEQPSTSNVPSAAQPDSTAELVSPPKEVQLLEVEVIQVKDDPLTETPAHKRVLHMHNFEKALKEITPSSSESLGSLADLRKWNDEFGEGRRGKKRSPWGRGLFGFVDAKPVEVPTEGKVAASTSTTPSSSS